MGYPLPVIHAAALKLQHALGSPGRWVKTQRAGPRPRISDPVGLGQGLGICILTSFQVMLPEKDHTVRTTLLIYNTLNSKVF